MPPRIGMCEMHSVHPRNIQTSNTASQAVLHKEVGSLSDMPAGRGGLGIGVLLAYICVLSAPLGQDLACECLTT